MQKIELKGLSPEQVDQLLPEGLISLCGVAAWLMVFAALQRRFSETAGGRMGRISRLNDAKF